MTKALLKSCFLIAVLQSCDTEKQIEKYEFPESEKLKREIVNSIEIPFQTGDTIIYQSFIGMCGNSSKDELNRYYEPHLNEQPYYDLLKLKTKRTVLFTGDRLHFIMDSLCKGKNSSTSFWDCFSKNKINLSITGEALTNNAIKLYENYSYNKDHIFIEKRFNYLNGKWTFRIIQTNKDITN